MKATINDFATGVMRTAVGVEVEVIEYDNGGKVAVIKMPPATKKSQHLHAGKTCRILSKWIDAEPPTEEETEMAKKAEKAATKDITESTPAAAEAMEDAGLQVGMSLDENGEVQVELTTDAPALDIVDEETGEEVVEGETEAEQTTAEEVVERIDDILLEETPVQTEMFVKSELDDAAAVLKHLTAERKKRIKAVDTAESNLDEIEQRVEEQKRVIARIQSQLPAAEPTLPAPTPDETEETEETDGLCRGKDCEMFVFDGGPNGTQQNRCESLQSDLNIVVAGQTPCPEVGKEEEPEDADDDSEDVPESDIEIEMDESDEDWMQDGDGEEA